MRDKLSNMIQSAVGGCAKYWADVIADKLLAEGVIVPPCKVGDAVYFVDKYEDGTFMEESRVTEVCSKGLFTSASFTPKDDMGNFESYEEIGKTVFLTREEAEKALAEMREK